MKPILLLIVAVSGLLLSGCQSPHADTVTQWEYKYAYNPVGVGPDVNKPPAAEFMKNKPLYETKFLNEMAKDGWIFIQRDESGGCYFKRPKT